MLEKGDKMKNLLIFLLGAACGAAGSYIVCKQHFDGELEAELDELREYREERSKRPKKGSKRVTEASEEPDDENIEDEEAESHEEAALKYSNVLKETGYSSKKPDPSEIVKKKHKYKKDPKIFLMSPSAYAASDKETKSVFLFNDGIVTDEDYEVIDNGYALLGGNDVIKEAEDTGEETVYIRNLNEDIDYEVTFDERTYSEFSPDEGPEDE